MEPRSRNGAETGAAAQRRRAPPPPARSRSVPSPTERGRGSPPARGAPPAPSRGSEPPAAPGRSVFRSGGAARRAAKRPGPPGGRLGDRTARLRRSRRAAAGGASERPPLPALAVAAGAAARRGAVRVPRGILAAQALPAHRARVVLRGEAGAERAARGRGRRDPGGRFLPAPARARCSRRGRSGCTAAAAPARPPRSPPCTPGTPTPCLRSPGRGAALGGGSPRPARAASAAPGRRRRGGGAHEEDPRLPNPPGTRTPTDLILSHRHRRQGGDLLFVGRGRPRVLQLPQELRGHEMRRGAQDEVWGTE